MRGNERCDEILRLIDTALDVEVPVARPAAPPAPPPPVSLAPVAPAGRRWLGRISRRPSRPDPRFVAPQASRADGPVRFATGLRTAGDLAARPARTAPGLPEAG